jgi:hypothetical protein
LNDNKDEKLFYSCKNIAEYAKWPLNDVVEWWHVMFWTHTLNYLVFSLFEKVLIWYSIFWWFLNLLGQWYIFGILKTVNFLVFNRSVTCHTLQFEYNKPIMKTKSENASAMYSTYTEDKYHTPSYCRHCKNITSVWLSLSQLSY